MSASKIKTKQKNTQPSDSAKKLATQICVLVSVIFGLLAVVLPLIPSATKQNETGRTIYFNMLRAMNNDIGTAELRDNAVWLVMFYIIGSILIVMGCISAYYKLWFSMAYNMSGSVAMFVFVIMWFNISSQPEDESAVIPVKSSLEIYSDSVIPVFMMILISGMFIASVVALVFFSMEKQENYVKTRRESAR